MEDEGAVGLTKRMKHSAVDEEKMLEDGTGEQLLEEEAAPADSNSELIEAEIAGILEKINNFTQMVSELLEFGKTLLKELSNEFEERLILVHKEQMEKWQEEIKELRLLDAANEETDVLLQNAKYLLQNVHGGS